MHELASDTLIKLGLQTSKEAFGSAEKPWKVWLAFLLTTPVIQFIYLSNIKHSFKWD